ncbi:MAG: hypothetical protein K5Q00_04685, partial [Gammaproteobacteria bacterium]|nr:hypothetical protein [Gammaproteobacteria bacterium]
FDAHGLVIQRLEMAETYCRIIKIPANVYYTFITLDHCLYLAVTSQNTTIQSADWAPTKDHAQQPSYRKQLVDAKIGDYITLSSL